MLHIGAAKAIYIYITEIMFISAAYTDSLSLAKILNPSVWPF